MHAYVFEFSHGHFRDAWLFDSTTHLDVDSFVYKRLRLNDDFDVDYFDMHKIHREAIVMERLTHSPRIIDIYGHCSTTILSEAMGANSEVWRDMIPGTGRATHKEYKAENKLEVKPRNNFTATEKLDISLQMAEALADMHGFEGGVILHGDTHPEQWLRGKDGRWVLNDFNNGEILDWNRDKSKYCGAYRKYGGFVSAHILLLLMVELCITKKRGVEWRI
jgi:serine/threonine protein kinase